MLKLGLAASPGTTLVLIGQTSNDSAGLLFTQLGIASVVCAVLFLWLRDVMKQRDRAVTNLETIQPILTDILHAVQRSNDAHITGAEAAKAVTVALQDLPDKRVWFRLEQVVGKMEAFERRESGG